MITRFLHSNLLSLFLLVQIRGKTINEIRKPTTRYVMFFHVSSYGKAAETVDPLKSPRQEQLR